MSVPLYFDQHVRAAITRGLRQRAVDVLTAQDDAMARAEDVVLLERASVLGRVLYTNDKHFPAIAHRWLREGRPFAGVIYSHQLAMGIGETIAELELIAKVAEPQDLQNRVIFLPW